ncbi:endothelin-converting enzyme 2-like [Cloeon dipterum]|uniref:endothelin-converting enzyme 2-like n=1 Tax=Cloeon dipterum TaxID=197152 RepID=UPI00321F9097
MTTINAGHYQEMTESELQEITDSHISTNSTNRFNWSVYFNQVLNIDGENARIKRKEKVKRIIVRDQQYFEWWSRLFHTSSPETIEMYIWWRVFSSLAPYTTREFQMRQQKLWQKVGGTRITTPRWKVCVEMVNKAYGYIVNFEYAKIHLDKDLREQALWMVSEIKEYIKRYGTKLNWMDSETKKQGLKKIESLRANVVNHDEPLFPSKLEQFYSLINFADGGLFESQLKILAALEASKLNSLYLTPKREPTLVYDSDQIKANATQDEWLAYIFGLQSAVNAYFDYHVSFFRPSSACVEDYSEEQIFFLSFANMWCSNKSPNSVNNLLTRRSMVLGTLSTINEFSRAWNCPKGSIMNPW